MTEPRIIIRKRDDGAYDAVLQHYCAGWMDVHTAFGNSPSEARRYLVRDIEEEIAMLEDDLYYAETKRTEEEKDVAPDQRMDFLYD